MTEEASKASSEWNKLFVEGKEGSEERLSQWDKIKTFYVKPPVFKMKEPQILVEDEIKGSDPLMPSKKVKTEVAGLKSRILKQIRKEMKAKYGIKEDCDLERKVHQMKVKEYIDVHLSVPERKSRDESLRGSYRNNVWKTWTATERIDSQQEYVPSFNKDS